MFNKRIISQAVFFIFASSMCVFAYAQDPLPQESDYDTYAYPDSNTMDNAIVIKIPDIGECDTDACKHGVFDAINKQEREYLSKMFGEEEVQWISEDRDNWEVDLRRDSKYYDVGHIKLIDTDERRVIYFDITDPVSRMKGEID